MPRLTAIVATDLRERLYDIAKQRAEGLSILYDTPWGDGLHYLDMVAEKASADLNGSHVDVVLDERGLRFNRDCDV